MASLRFHLVHALHVYVYKPCTCAAVSLCGLCLQEQFDLKAAVLNTHIERRLGNSCSAFSWKTRENDERPRSGGESSAAPRSSSTQRRPSAVIPKSSSAQLHNGGKPGWAESSVSTQTLTQTRSLQRHVLFLAGRHNLYFERNVSSLQSSRRAFAETLQEVFKCSVSADNVAVNKCVYSSVSSRGRVA